MPEVTKLVRFFEPMVVDGQDQQKTIGSDFWRETWDRVSQLAANHRVHTYNLVRFYGEAGRELTRGFHRA